MNKKNTIKLKIEFFMGNYYQNISAIFSFFLLTELPAVAQTKEKMLYLRNNCTKQITQKN